MPITVLIKIQIIASYFFSCFYVLIGDLKNDTVVWYYRICILTTRVVHISDIVINNSFVSFQNRVGFITKVLFTLNIELEFLYCQWNIKKLIFKYSLSLFEIFSYFQTETIFIGLYNHTIWQDNISYIKNILLLFIIHH